MNINITFRHVAPSDAIKRHASDKLGKLQKFLRRPMTAKVTLSIDRLKHIAEVRVSSGGEHLEAKESGEDMYVSIDRVMEKLERQIRDVAERIGLHPGEADLAALDRAELEQLERPFAVSLAKIAEGTLRSERGGQFLGHGVFIDCFIEAAVEHGKKVSHRRFRELARFLLALINIDMTAENECIGCRFPPFFSRFAAIIVKSVFDLSGGLVNLRARQMALHAPLD